MSENNNSTNIAENLFEMLENDFQVKNTNYDVLVTKAKVKNSNRCDRGKDNSILIDCGDICDTYLEITSKGMQIVEGV